jgi:hypothetical protein
MITPTFKRLLGTAALALALAACKDSTGSGENPSGDLAFTYTGARTGDFAASGSYDPDSDELLDYTVAFVIRGELVLLASDKLATGRSNVFVLYSPPAVGSTSCSADIAPVVCPIRGELLTGASSDPNQPHEGLFRGYVGTVVLSEIANNRVRGSFQITLQGEGGAVGKLEVRSGTFDAPVVSALQLDPNRGLRPPAAPPSFGGR